MTQTKTELKISDIEVFAETEKFFIPPAGAFVKRKKLLQLLDELKEAFNDDLKELREINRDKEKIINDAHDEARRIKQKAISEMENQDIVKRATAYATELAQKANEKAERTINEAKEQSEKLLNEAKDLRNQLIINSHRYVDTLFEDLEKELVKRQEELSVNREQLRLSLEKKMELMKKLSN